MTEQYAGLNMLNEHLLRAAAAALVTMEETDAAQAINKVLLSHRIRPLTIPELILNYVSHPQSVDIKLGDLFDVFSDTSLGTVARAIQILLDQGKLELTSDRKVILGKGKPWSRSR